MWQPIQVRVELYSQIRKLAFPEPELEIRAVTSALLEYVLQPEHEDAVKAILTKLREHTK